MDLEKSQLKISSENRLSAPSPETYSPDGSPKVKQRRAKPVIFWTVDDVLKWLHRHAKPEGEAYSHFFQKHSITGRCLRAMSEDRLSMIGVTSPEDRRALMQHIYRLRLKHDTVDLNNMMKSKPR